MSTTNTEPLFVSTPSPLPLDQITFTITSPQPHSPLFLGFIQINARSPSASGVIGTVDPGSSTADAPAMHVFKMGSKFTQIRQFLQDNAGRPIAIVITYDPVSLFAFDLNPVAMLMAANG